MNKKSQYSVSFYSDRLSAEKYQSIKNFAVFAVSVKNELSASFQKDFKNNIKKDKYSYIVDSLPLIKEKIKSHFATKLMEDVYICYQNKYEQIKYKMEFRVVKEIKYNFYVKGSKKHPKGSLKTIDYKRSSTQLTKCLTYLSRHGDEHILTWLPIKMQDPKLKPENLQYYKNIIETINKFGLERLLTLAVIRRDFVVNKHFCKPIPFKKLTFRGRSRLKEPILSYNRHYNSTIKAFINISWMEYGQKMIIPVMYSKKHHGNMAQYQNGTYTSHTICIEENGYVRVILSFKGEREYPSKKTNFVGIDVNTKHNLIQCSNGASIDFDRRLVSTICKELKKTDDLKKIDKDYISGKRRTNKLNHLRRELKSKNQNEIANLCKIFNSQNVDHAIFEDLNNGFGKCYVKTADDVNFNRMVKELHLSSLKDEFEHIARKYGIATSFVHSAYTSQTCPKCGCVDAENRENQEEFKCIECGYECNADLNASGNILNRVVLAVLRDELLEKSTLGNGSFVPKALPREKVKEVVLSYRKHLPSKDMVNKEFEEDLF